VRAALQKLDGVIEAKCDPDKHEARVTHLASKVKVDAMLKAMKDAGFEGKLVKVEPTS
jgi:copper chaperone CopZ